MNDTWFDHRKNVHIHKKCFKLICDQIIAISHFVTFTLEI